MSSPAQELEQIDQELQVTTQGHYAPEDIKIRMEFAKQGIKVGDPRCNGISMAPDDITSCGCVKAAGKTAAYCTRTDGLKCFKSSKFSSKWTDALKKAKMGDCAVDWPPPPTAAPVAPVFANSKNCFGLPVSCGHIAIGVGVVLIILIMLGKVKI